MDPSNSELEMADIREGPPEQYWDRLRQMMGPSGLMTYWYLGRAFNQIEDPDSMLLRRDMRNARGGILAAPLAIAAPETGGWRDRDVVPAPIAYGLHIIDDARDVTAIRVTRSTVGQGRKMGFSRSEIVDAANQDRVIARTTGIGVNLGAAPPGFRPVDLPPELPDTANLDGWRLPPLTSRHASTSASLHLGPIHVALEAAATESAAERAGTDVLQIEEWDVHFVAPGTVGPFLVSADSNVGRTGRVVTRLTLVDEGRDGTVVAVGAAGFRAHPA